MSLSDEQIKFEASLADPGFQAMQEINEWFEHNRQTSHEGLVSQADEADSGVVEILDNLTDLSLTFADIALNGIEFSALVGIGGALELASLPVILLTRGMLAIQSSEEDRHNAEYAFSLMSAEGLAYFLAHLAFYRRAPSDKEMSSASHIFKAVKAINDIAEDIEKLETGSTARKRVLAAARIDKATWSLHPQSPANSSVKASPQPAESPSPSQASISSSGTEADRSSGEAVGSSIHSAQRQTFGAPSSFAWGDPQENQFKLTNGTSSRGMNQFGSLLPRYAGGTSEGNQHQFQFLQDDDEQENTVVATPEGISRDPDSQTSQFNDDMTPDNDD